MKYLCFALLVALLTVEWIKFIAYGPSITALLVVSYTTTALLSIKQK